MLIAHISDMHGVFPAIKQCDIIVNSGDTCPNFNPKDRVLEEHLQENWVRTNLSRFQKMIGDHPYVHLQGNHDFFNPVSLLQSAGINAFDCTHTTVTIQTTDFRGIPYVPAMSGVWEYELTPVGLQYAVNDLTIHLSGVDVLVAHCPPKYVLDYVPGADLHIGNEPLNAMLRHERFPNLKTLLCGHVHEMGGIVKLFDDYLLVSNAATTVNYVEL